MILSDFGIAVSLIPTSEVEMDHRPFRIGLIAVHLPSHHLLFNLNFARKCFMECLMELPLLLRFRVYVIS
jgi:hypothetical protein